MSGRYAPPGRRGKSWRADEVTELRVTEVASMDELPPGAAGLFPLAPFDLSAAWFRAVEAAAVPPGGRVFYLLCSEGPRPGAVWPMLEVRGQVQGLTTPYTLHYAPALAADPVAAGRAVGRALRRWPVVRLDALEAEAEAAAPLLQGVRAAGLLVLPFDHFGNWHEAVQDWPSYLAARPGRLREVVRRRLRAVADGRLVPEIVSAPEAVGPALDAYEDVYRRSWKVPEPHPQFAAHFLRAAAVAGVLRLGLLRHEGRAVAAQYWTVEDGVATVHKLAHDETLKALSPGTVLTAHMVRHVIEQDGARELDFGRGDDDYKQLWTSARRQRIGCVLANPRRVGGLVAAGRHMAGVLRRRVAGPAGTV